MNATLSPTIAQTQQAFLPKAANLSHVMPIGWLCRKDEKVGRLNLL